MQETLPIGPGRTDMLLVRLSLPRLSIKNILGLAALPPWEELPSGAEPGYAALAQLGNNYTELWTIHYRNTRPFPLAEKNGAQRLMPLRRWPDYEAQMRERQERRHALRHALANELITARRVLELPETGQTPQQLAQALAPELAVSYTLSPAPTQEQFMAQISADPEPSAFQQAEPPLRYPNGEYPADWREQAAERYAEAIYRVHRTLGPNPPPPA